MAAHTFMLPKKGIFGINANVANTTRDGTSGTKFLLATMGGSGGFFNSVNIQSLGTNAACVIRFFLNNGSDDTVATNNTMIAEAQMLATTAAETTGLFNFTKILDHYAAAGSRLYATRSAFTAGNAGFALLADYMEI